MPGRQVALSCQIAVCEFTLSLSRLSMPSGKLEMHSYRHIVSDTCLTLLAVSTSLPMASHSARSPFGRSASVSSPGLFCRFSRFLQRKCDCCV